jgi:carboxyl-terminal processing protease
MARATLTERQRRAVFERALRYAGDHCVWLTPQDERLATLRATHEAAIMRAQQVEDFERGMNDMLRELGGHAGIRHRRDQRAPARRTIAAALVIAHGTPDGDRWAFQHVQPGGPAARAGIHDGDVLLAIEGRDIAPPETRRLDPGRSYKLTVRTKSAGSTEIHLDLPGGTPAPAPQRAVTASRLQPDVGLVQIDRFDGVFGIDVAREIAAAISALQCSQLMIDLRFNRGGGLGCLRLMSLLCPDIRGVGFSVSRARLNNGYDKDRLRRFERIPASKWGLLPLILRFGFCDRSVAVFSEGLGPQRHHGRVVLLVNEASASAAEMVAAFARENGLATVVGSRTAGSVAGMRLFNVGYGYRLGLPVVAYFTWQHRQIEGVGVEPDIAEPLCVHALRRGVDTQLARAEMVLAGKSVP